MDTLLDYLDDIEDILENSKKTPLRSTIMLEKERVTAIITEMRMSLPVEFRNAQRVMENHDKIIDTANHKASVILQDAEAEAKILCNQHEIFQRASQQATDILEEAKRDAREMRLNARDYCDELLEKAEAKIAEIRDSMKQQQELIAEYFDQTIDVVYENRQQLRGS
jgi:vacuolar-type H+-ATPase subunit H